VSETEPIRPCGNDVAAYALGALDASEIDAFRRHLEQCAVCRDELAAFQSVAEALPMAAKQYRAPDRLRQRVLQTAESEPKRESTPAQGRARPRRFGFALPRPAIALAAVLAVAVIAVGVVALTSTGTGTRVYQAQVTGSTGTAQVRVSDGRAELIVNHFQPPPAGKIYEVWLGRPDRAPQPTSALFSITASGKGDVDVPGNLDGVSQVLVTPEPAGGSKVPTHSPVIQAKLT
jgi:anti-sigma-K factor RskA